MIDDRELAIKKLDLLYGSENIGRSELILETYRLLTNGLISFKTCCEKLQNIDPVQRTDRFLDVVYGLYLYLHPDFVTASRCLKSEGEYGIQASQLVESRFTNRFGEFYLENSPILIRYVSHFLKPVFEPEETTDATEATESTTVGETEVPEAPVVEKISPNIDLQTVHWIIETEKQRLEQNLEYYANPISIFESPVVTMFETLEKHKVESHSDAFNFVQRLKSVMLEIHQLTQFMEKQRSLKSVELPKVVAQQCYDMIQGFLKVEPHDHTFMKNFKTDLDALHYSEEIYKIALEFVNDSVYRALYHLGDWINEFFLEEDEVPADRNVEPNQTDEEEYVLSDYSVCCDRNRGREYYTYCLRHHTTTELSPEEIHNLGLSEVERISKEMLQSIQDHLRYQISGDRVETFEDSIEYNIRWNMISIIETIYLLYTQLE
jgi:hypothetical protein